MKHYYATGKVKKAFQSLLAALPLACLGIGQANAQVSAYSFSSTVGTYQELAPADVNNLDSVVSTGTMDEANYKRPLGFTFRYNNQDYTSVTVSTNGFLALGTTTGAQYGFSNMIDFREGNTFAFDYTRLPNLRLPAGLEAIIGAFIGDHRRSFVAGVGSIYMVTTGTAPNRRFVAQWKNWRRYFPTGASSDASGDDFNFQIILHETSNLIEVVYGNMMMTAGDFRPQVGIRGQSPDARDIMVVTGNWNALNRTSNGAAQVPTSPGNRPANGLTLQFAPIPPAPNDLGVASIISPRTNEPTCVLTAQEPVRIVVRNYGTQAQNQVTATYRFNGVNSAPQTFAVAIAPNQSDTLEFTARVNMAASGPYALRAWTTLPTEPAPNHANDTSGVSVTLGPATPPRDSLGTLAEIVGAGWKEGQGVGSPTGTTSNWTTGFPINSSTAALPFSPTGTNSLQNEWLISPNYNLSPSFFLVFKAYVTKGLSGDGIIDNIRDDTVKVMVSTDCGDTWRTIRRFSQAEVAAGVIDNTVREFRVPLVAAPGSVRVAVFGTSNGTPAQDTWRFHIDDIKFLEVRENDLGVTRIVSPVSGQPGCLLGPQECVTVVVKNFGSATQNQGTVKYRVRSRAGVGPERTAQFTFTPPLAPGNEDTVSFCGANGVNLSQPGSLLIQAYSSAPGETDFSHLNDTVKSDSVRLSSPLAPTQAVITTFAEGTARGWGRGRGAQRPTGTVSSWTTSLATPYNFIGLPFSATAGTSLREWWYSPTYQGTASTSITFKAAIMAGGSAGPAPNGMEDDTVYVRASNDCGATWRTIAKFSQADVTSGRLSNTFTEYSFLVPSAGQGVSFGFFGVNLNTASAITYRFALDDVKVRNAVQNDQGVARVVSPITNVAQCTQACAQPTVVIRNYGTAPQTSATVSYIMNGGAPKTETFTLSPALPPGASDTVTFSTANCADMSAPGTYTFRFYTTTAGEDNETAQNDTLRNYSVVTRAAVSVPGTGAQEETFENLTTSVPAGWLAETNQFRDWKVLLGRGANLGGFPSDAFSTQLYFVNTNSWFVTPRYVLPATAGTSLQFDYRIVDGDRDEAEELAATDSIIVEVSTTCGSSWTRLMRIDSTNHMAASTFTMKTIPLDSYLNQEVVFRVQAWIARNTATGTFVDLDNWRIGAPVSAKNRITAGGYRLAPNPASERVVLTGDMGKAHVAVVSALGQKVLTTTLAEGRAELDLSGLTPGMYRVVVTPADGKTARVLTLVKE